MSKVTTQALTDTFGVEVRGVKISSDAETSTIEAVRDLWARHKILLFRDQSASEKDLVDFSSQFGGLEIHVRTEYLSSEYPEILYVSNLKENGLPVGILADTEVGWHYDQIYLPRPALGSLLCAVQIPPTGGNTYFADMSAAYEALSADMKQKLEGKKATQSYEVFNAAYSVPTNEKQKKRSPDIDQPLIRTHPVTGKKSLYLCPGMTTRIVDMEEKESRETLDYLFDWTVKPEFVYTHQWRQGDCLMWDNACTMHRRDPFDHQYTRIMKRTTILPPAELAVPF